MLRGLTVSILVHSAVIAAAVVSWPTERNECERLIEALRDEQPGISPIDIAMRYPRCASALSVPIDIIDIGDVTNVAAVIKPEEPPEDEPEEQVLEQQEEDLDADPDLEEDIPEDEPDTNSQRAEEIDPEEVVIEEDDTKPDEGETEEPVEEPKQEKLIQKKPREATDSLDFLDEFEDTLKTKAKDRPKAPPKQDEPMITPELTEVEQARRGVGEKTGNTASIQAALKRQVESCWIGVDDLPEPERLRVSIEIELDRDGNLINNGKLVSPARRPVGDRPMQTAVERALRAVRSCAPYQLPDDDYDAWKSTTLRIGREIK